MQHKHFMSTYNTDSTTQTSLFKNAPSLTLIFRGISFIWPLSLAQNNRDLISVLNDSVLRHFWKVLVSSQDSWLVLDSRKSGSHGLMSTDSKSIICDDGSNGWMVT